MKNETGTLNLIKYTLWGIGKPEADEGVFSDLKDHTLIALRDTAGDQLVQPDGRRRAAPGRTG